MPYRALDLSRLQIARVSCQTPSPPPPPGAAAEWQALAAVVAAARSAGRPLVCMIGGAAVAAGLGMAVARLLQRGVVTHVAADGAAAATDFALALSGEVCADGSGTLSDDAGHLLHAALRRGVWDGLGAGEALGRELAGDARYAHREASLLYQTYAQGVPFTVHATPGADGLSLHPACDFAALGRASGRDLAVLAVAVAAPEGGVCLNLGLGRLGEALFEGALAAARGTGRAPGPWTSTRIDAEGEWLEAARRLAATLATVDLAPPEPLGGGSLREAPQGKDPRAVVARRSPGAAQALEALLAREPGLAPAAADLARAYLAIAGSLEQGGTLFLCGNGGSMADALHISGELLKSYARPRPLPPAHRTRLAGEPGGEALADNLEGGLRAVVLGVNPSLASAVENDFDARGLAYAQELYALARPGDAFLGISTSGRAANVGSAASVARALGLATVALTGADGGPLADRVDVAVRAPAHRTDRIQEQHVLLYHTLCEMLETDFFSMAPLP